MLLAVVGSAGTVAMAFAPSAAAHGLLDHEEASVPGQVRAALGNGVVPAAENGLYEVPVADGAELTTHGPDPLLAAGPAATGSKGGPRRRLACATGRQTRFLYARPAKAKGKVAKKSKRLIQRAAKEANALIDRSSIAEGGPHADLYTKCNRRGRMAVATFRSSALDYQALVRKAQRAGFSSTEVDYVILSPRRDFGSCGIASYSPDERLSSINVNLTGGYAVVYRPCWTAEGLAHEIGHLQGAVQYAAPFSTGDGRHCFDELDAMCYVPDGGDLHQTGPVGRCPEMRFDCGGDTYFDSAPEPGEWLETHWNLGSPLNSYIRFSD